jgi:cell division protein FtsB
VRQTPRGQASRGQASRGQSAARARSEAKPEVERPGSSGKRPSRQGPGSKGRTRSVNRPAAGRRAVPPGSAKRTRAPRPRRLTGRATVLAGVLVVLLLAYAYPVRVYLSQQAEIEALRQEQAAQQGRIGQLTEERAKWNDDEYVRVQARRLNYFLPGETPYVVLEREAPPSAPGADPNAGKKAPIPWYGGLWASINAANR